ncbi:MAG: hypothetical protein ACYC4E_01360 [Carboxydocellales bacterium]
MEIRQIITAAKYLQLVVIVFFSILMFFLFFKSNNGIAFALETTGTEFGISTFPTSGFLKAPNLAPGDKVSAILSVKNDGKLDFTYNISSQLDSADSLLYNVINVEIQQGSTVLYTGNLTDLQNVAIGVLAPQATDVLNFTITLPPECDNLYQGKSAAVTLILNAKEHQSSIDGSCVDWDPPLEKADIHVSKGKKMPMRFHLIKDGTYDKVKRGIDLILTGTGPTGTSVTYIFSTTNDTLSWDAQLQKPHYELLLDTEKYPVKIGTYYTAIVKYGDQILGKTSFVRGN